MSKRFETLFATKPNLYAENAPVMLSAGVLLQDADSNRLVAQLKFRSVSPKTIHALTISLACVDTANNPTGEVLSYQYQDLSVPHGTEFGSNKAILLPHNTRSYAITSVTAVFYDGTTASCNETFSPMPTVAALDAALPDKETVKQYRLATKENAQFAPIDSMGLHLCPCGTWHTAKFCVNCGQSHEAAMAAYHLPTLTADKNARLAQEEADREEARRKEAYNKALKLMNTAKLPVQLQKAEKDFDALGDYENSAELADTCRQKLMELALKKAESPKNVYDLKEAEKIFLHLGEMEGCAELAEQCRIRSGKGVEKIKAKTKRTVKRICIAAVIVAIIIAMIPISTNYIIPAVKYAQAEKALETANFDKAIEVFTELGEYKDAETRVSDSTYAKADALLTAGSYDEAADLFKSLGQFADSRTRVKETHYLHGKALVAENKHAEAYEFYKLAKGYEDASAQMDNCCLVLAKSAYDAARYDEAVTWYGKMGTLNKEDETYLDSLYLAAMAAMEQQQYQKAVDLLQKAVNYKDSPEQRRAAMYAYITSTMNPADKTTLLYINRLTSVDYSDSRALYERLYGWKVTVTANNNSKNADNMESIKKYNSLYFHIHTEGGIPEESITLYAQIKTPANTTKVELEPMLNGQTRFVTSNSTRVTGTATITVYNKETNDVVATHSIQIS